MLVDHIDKIKQGSFILFDNVAKKGSHQLYIGEVREVETTTGWVGLRLALSFDRDYGVTNRITDTGFFPFEERESFKWKVYILSNKEYIKEKYNI